MDFFDVINARYSHKEKFLPTPVPLHDLEKIAQAGLAAPSGMNSQCVRLIILPDRDAVQALCEVAPTDGMQTAPAAIAMLTDRSVQKGEVNFEMEDYSAAAENMLLAATALGYVSLWLDSPYFDSQKQKHALDVLGADKSKHHLRVVLPIGLPDGEGSRREKLPFNERVSYGKFGESK
ncbi:MAG: nitroreductase family protein [Oscillospiraceae bacterium]|nr:nitroreductase family protein [Oscillospiraceae bacterium]